MTKLRAQKIVNLGDDQGLDGVIVCAKWLVSELERLGCQSLANIFDKAVEDAESWIENMGEQQDVSDCKEAIEAREAYQILTLLKKYAAIQDPEKRQALLDLISGISSKETLN